MELQSEVSLLPNLLRGKLPIGDIYCYVQLVVGAMYARGEESPYVAKTCLCPGRLRILSCNI